MKENVTYKATMRISALALALAIPLLSALPSAAADLPPASLFFNNPRFGAMKLSPNGRHLAARIGGQGHRDGLVVITLEDQSMQMVAQYNNIDVGDFEWVNDNRLVYDTRDRTVASGARTHAPGLFAVNRDGGKMLQLAMRDGDDEPSTIGTAFKPTLQPWNTYLLGQEGSQLDDSVYVVRPEWRGNELASFNLLRLNTLTARAVGVERPPQMIDVQLDLQGEPRVATTADRDRVAIHYRDPASNAWRQLAEFPAYGDTPDSFTPVGMGGDGTLYVSSGAGGDKRQVRSYNIATRELGKEALVNLGEYDFQGELIHGNGKVLGVSLLTDARSTHWWDKGAAALQQEVDKQLPGTINEIALPRRPETPYALVMSYADRQPPVYMVYNQTSKTFIKLGEARPGIAPKQLGQRSLIRYKARDGLSIPAWLTMPPGGVKSKLPLVVLVHGGPFVRGGEWNFDPQAQFLASRGYAVLQPEFRGSTGFGTAHFKAGWKQWGLAMQDDLADGARALIANGTADAGRICIAGASYGGYAVLMGLAKDGDLYKCGVEWAGVTDINLMYTDTWNVQSDLSERWKRYGMPLLIGDPVKDAAQLKATSPLELADRIRQPLLMAYGDKDERVPLFHGRKFHAAVKPANSQAELVVYRGEGHGWSLPENRIDFWSRVEKFLDKNIGPGSAK